MAVILCRGWLGTVSGVFVPAIETVVVAVTQLTLLHTDSIVALCLATSALEHTCKGTQHHLY